MIHRQKSIRVQGVDDVKFPNLLQAYVYALLIKYKIPFRMKVQYVVLPDFQYGNNIVKKISFSPHFVVYDKNNNERFIIFVYKSKWNVRGEELKRTLLKYAFLKMNKKPTFLIIYNKEEANYYITQVNKIINQK